MITDGNDKAYAAQHSLGMGRHVVGALQGVQHAGFILWNKAVENGFQIMPHIGIIAFIDG